MCLRNVNRVDIALAITQQRLCAPDVHIAHGRERERDGTGGVNVMIMRTGAEKVAVGTGVTKIALVRDTKSGIETTIKNEIVNGTETERDEESARRTELRVDTVTATATGNETANVSAMIETIERGVGSVGMRWMMRWMVAMLKNVPRESGTTIVWKNLLFLHLPLLQDYHHHRLPWQKVLVVAEIAHVNLTVGTVIGLLDLLAILETNLTIHPVIDVKRNVDALKAGFLHPRMLVSSTVATASPLASGQFILVSYLQRSYGSA